MIANTTRQAYIEKLYQEYHAHDKLQIDRLQRWRSINPEAAALLSFMVLSKQAKHIWKLAHRVDILRCGLLTLPSKPKDISRP